MKQKNKGLLLSLVLALIMLMTVTSAAEENLYDKLLPLMDQAAAATVPDAAAQGYVGVRPMAMELSPEGDAVVVLGDLYAAGAQLDTLTAEEYGEVNWLDQRVVVQLERDASAEAGWKVASFRLDAELLMEDAAQAYFSEAMSTYMNEPLGFSVQYPAIFTELEEMETGMHAQLRDGSASFLAERVANTGRQGLQSFVETEQARRPEAKLSQNEASGVVRLTWTENGITTADVFAVSEQWIYHAQLRWTDSLSADFVLYSDYVMNSLSADEMGIG